MTRKRLSRLLLAVIVATAGHVTAQDVRSPETGETHRSAKLAYVLDGEALNVTAIDVLTGLHAGEVSIDGPERAHCDEDEIRNYNKPFLHFELYKNPTGSRLVALEYCDSADVVTIIDPERLSVIARMKLDGEIRWLKKEDPRDPDEQKRVVSLRGGLGIHGESPTALFSPGGRLLTFPLSEPWDFTKDGTLVRDATGGFEKPWRLVTIDLIAGRVSERVDLGDWGLSPEIVRGKDDRKAFALIRRNDGPFPQTRIIELRIIDLGDSSQSRSIPLNVGGKYRGNGALSPDEDYFYVLESTGAPRTRVHVISLDTVSLESKQHEELSWGAAFHGAWAHDILDLGRSHETEIGSFAEIGKRLLLSRTWAGSKKKRAQQLTVITGAEAAQVELPMEIPGRLQENLRLSQDGRRVFLRGRAAISALDRETLTPITTIPLENIPFSTAQWSLPVLALTPDGALGLLHGSSKLTVVDFETGETVGSLATGRGGAKVVAFLKELGLASLGGYFLSGGTNTVAVRPDGKFAYVANMKSDDITVVDLQKVNVVDKLAGGGAPVILSRNVLMVLKSDNIGLIDMQSNRGVNELDIEGRMRNVVLAANGEHAVVLSEKALVCIDSGSGETVSQYGNFGEAHDVVLQ